MQNLGTQQQEAEKRLNNLKTEHNKYLPAYQTLSTYINPTRGIFNGDRTKIGRMIDHQTLISSYATRCQRVFASGMNSGMTNKSTEWFRPEFDNPAYLEIPGAAQALDDLRDRMYSILNQSNIYDVFYQSYEEMGQFGPACFLVLEDFEDVMRGRSFTAGEYYLATDNKGRVNTFGREFEMTIAQLVKEFGLLNCSDMVRAQWENNQVDVKVKVGHLIEPNDTRIPGYNDFKNMPWRSLYWERGRNEDKFLAKRGFKRFPVIAPRWDTITTDDVYGYGPGWHAIGSIKELQKTRQDKLLVQEKIHNPPMNQDASVEGHANLVPGGVTKSNSVVPNTGVRPAYQISDRLDSFIQLLDEEKQEIDSFFFVDLFLMLMNVSTQNMTATEVAERQQEKIMMMGPALHRLDEQMLTPLLTLLYGIMEDNGLLPEFPPELQGVKIKIKYTSILAQAQRSLGVNKIERVLGIVTEFAQVFPNMAQNVDQDEAIRQINEMEGAPSKIMKEKQDVEAERDYQAKQTQMMQAAELANSAADTTKKLSDAKKTADPSALDGIMAGMKNMAGAR